MLRFKEFITEEISSSDAKGKLHELLVAKHLSNEKELPTHFRDENNKRPQDVHDNIVSNYMSTPDSNGKVGVEHEDYVAADKRAKDAADHIKSKLGNDFDFNRIKRVAWTSQASDHKKLTGKEDKNSDADVMLHLNRHEDETNHPGHYVGLSLKVGNQKPNLRNPGIDQLNKLTKADPEHIKSILTRHNQNMHDLGYDRSKSQETNHAIYKEDKSGKFGSDRKARSESAEGFSRHARREMAKHYAESINNMPETERNGHVENMMTSLIAPKTTFPHYRIHTKVGANGKTSQHFEDHQKEFEDTHLGHDGYEAVHSGIGFHIHALKRNEDGTMSRGKRLATINLKGSSGPLKGFAGTVKSD